MAAVTEDTHAHHLNLAVPCISSLRRDPRSDSPPFLRRPNFRLTDLPAINIRSYGSSTEHNSEVALHSFLPYGITRLKDSKSLSRLDSATANSTDIRLFVTRVTQNPAPVIGWFGKIKLWAGAGSVKGIKTSGKPLLKREHGVSTSLVWLLDILLSTATRLMHCVNVRSSLDPSQST